MATKIIRYCEKCQVETDHWDNRTNKRNPKAPDFKCTVCNNPIWPPKGKQAPKPSNTPPQAQQAPKNTIPESVWKEKDLRIARESVLDTAREIFKFAKMESKDSLGKEEITDIITSIGDRLVEWVYGKTGAEEVGF